ncbi:MULTISPECIES: lipid IV(A) 4-amino-4-deoxy-L-arabinosyltransferase [unclassified Pseudomonas]|uniref:lipid IV(A) 4-amino-4-deoxy-L-arabinosyltransferase n=1 Tax=unclassified Pseudomonas TaxID=196821 RepID=UPI002AC97796|nr:MULTISPECIES: lipid IV(A) 4-amino-4-deoxy-L-arabinosyltransferase [unclassified Pseudomonas]MEB0039913.1 lipid IV(A) 4-amino-4-deoxy-L-arabinosyltransferase [Pseudomonas sp. MH10]MEB0077146.1 lipid IV(A) 4-amino-4-deoxy-L-arabinosyltransferase [Pseudomonas sp. MH10out]MEB0093055.1 lipid IV(A) 4-amino-4-deoxy-L-arabinosyltransferase [Pseudomonas sp. CCI4.2]MEB0102259.1 lipid IV(A) 4-amino-4-deoxy-L-arabinosyltransferase [Pseudomonas sp. CCI3.2]MEB0123525.1 lipid IV(A) 4-amino-4-deoxy-L-arabi
MAKPWALLFLLLAFVIFYLLPLTTHGLWVPDETRYAQVSQEMLLTGKWAAPHLMGLRYFEKPALGYWMIALGQALFGDNLFGVRIASALSLGLSTVLAYLIARRLWNSPRRSLACATVYMSFGLIIGQAGYANLDPQFTLWVNLSIVALWYAVDSTTHRAKVIAWAVLGLACGMGFMTKGFLALLLPVLIALPYMIWQRRFKELVRYGGIAVLVATLISLPWVLTIQVREPDFWRFFFWHEHIRRFAGDDAQHAEPWWFYLPLLIGSSVPWALLLPTALKHAWQNRKQQNTAFLLLWLCLPLAFFSLSKGKLPPYILPCMLPLALLLGDALINRLEQAKTLAIRSNAAFNIVAGAVGLMAVIYLQIKHPIFDHEPLHMALLIVALASWILANALQLSKPQMFYLAPALGMWLMVALLPAALPDNVVENKTPGRFIAEHAQALRQSHALMSNDLAVASALAWKTANPEVTLYNTVGEAKYGLAYPDVTDRTVKTANVQQWLAQARREGSVGVVMRVKSDDERRELEQLPTDATRYDRGSEVILLYTQTEPNHISIK